MCDIIIQDGTVVTMDPQRRIIEEGAIAIEGNKIIDVGQKSELKNKYNADRIISANKKLILPGFINAHTHAMHCLLRGGLSTDRGFYEWILNSLWPGIAAYNAGDAQIATKLYCMESLRSGITMTVDNPELTKKEELTEAALDVYKRIGVRVAYAWCFYDNLELNASMKSFMAKESEVIRPDVAELNEDTDAALKNTEKTIKKHHKTSNGRMHIWPAPCVAAWVTKEGLLGSLELARKYDTMLTVHVAEGKQDEFQEGMRSIEYLSKIGFLDSRLLAAHCVSANESDIHLLKLHDVKVSHQAITNMIGGAGIPLITKMIAEGITVGLGTDDPNHNDSVNMIQLMKVAALLHKVNNRNATAITAEKILEMATIDGARAVGMESEIGSIEKGKKADLIILDMHRPHLIPCHHVPSVLVYQANGTEIETTIVDGKILMENGRFSFMNETEEKKILLDAQKASDRIVKRAHMEKLKNRGWISFL